MCVQSSVNRILSVCQILWHGVARYSSPPINNRRNMCVQTSVNRILSVCQMSWHGVARSSWPPINNRRDMCVQSSVNRILNVYQILWHVLQDVLKVLRMYLLPLLSCLCSCVSIISRHSGQRWSCVMSVIWLGSLTLRRKQLWMMWCSLYELDLSVGLLALIVFGLMSLLGSLPCVDYKSALFIVLNSTSNNGGVQRTAGLVSNHSLILDLCECEHVVDMLLSVLNSTILWRLASQKSFESMLLLVLAYVNQACMLHSCDLVSFYVCLEGQNFCFIVLCGLQNKGSSVESCFSSKPCLQPAACDSSNSLNQAKLRIYIFDTLVKVLTVL
jgi:hypothetical protein